MLEMVEVVMDSYGFGLWLGIFIIGSLVWFVDDCW